MANRRSFFLGSLVAVVVGSGVMSFAAGGQGHLVAPVRIDPARARNSRDRRVVTARATKKALELLAELDGPATEFAKKCMKGLEPRRLEELSESLERVRE